MRYSSEFKEKISRQLFPPDAKTIGEVSRKTGVPSSTVFYWKKLYREKGRQLSKDSSSKKGLTGKEKFSILIETANLNEHELSEYCREKRLYPEQVKEWKKAAVAVNESSGKPLSRKERKELNKEKHKVKKLQKELNRKDKALAETAALLVLKKKAQAIWGDDEED